MCVFSYPRPQFSWDRTTFGVWHCGFFIPSALCIIQDGIHIKSVERPRNATSQGCDEANGFRVPINGFQTAMVSFILKNQKNRVIKPSTNIDIQLEWTRSQQTADIGVRGETVAVADGRRDGRAHAEAFQSSPPHLLVWWTEKVQNRLTYFSGFCVPKIIRIDYIFDELLKVTSGFASSPGLIARCARSAPIPRCACSTPPRTSDLCSLQTCVVKQLVAKHTCCGVTLCIYLGRKRSTSVFYVFSSSSS